MTPNTNETQIQNNTIDLLKNMAYIYIFLEELIKHMSSTRQVILKDILLKLNGFEYKEQKYGLMKKLLNQEMMGER